MVLWYCMELRLCWNWLLVAVVQIVPLHSLAVDTSLDNDVQELVPQPNSLLRPDGPQGISVDVASEEAFPKAWRLVSLLDWASGVERREMQVQGLLEWPVLRAGPHLQTLVCRLLPKVTRDLPFPFLSP